MIKQAKLRVYERHLCCHLRASITDARRRLGNIIISQPLSPKKSHIVCKFDTVIVSDLPAVSILSCHRSTKVSDRKVVSALVWPTVPISHNYHWLEKSGSNTLFHII